MNRLKELRKEKKDTQAELANLMGVNVKTISRWEKGEFEIKPAQAKMLADYFGVSASYLLGLTNAKNVEIAVNFHDKKDSLLYVSAKQLSSIAEQQKRLVKESTKQTQHYIKKIEKIKNKGVEKYKDVDIKGNLKAIQVLLGNVNELSKEILLSSLWKKENNTLSKNDFQSLKELEFAFHAIVTDFKDWETLIEDEILISPTDND
ncbi:helix-turn-helix domain-containing protein [Streptococcus alactolyticus]